MTKRRLPVIEHADTLSLKALRELLTGLVQRADRADIRIEKLEACHFAFNREIPPQQFQQGSRALNLRFGS